MEDGINLASLFGPTPVFLTSEQLAAVVELANSTENAVAVMLLNDGGATVTARVVTGTRPIPSESEVDATTETVISVTGGVYNLGITQEDLDAESPEGYNEKLQAALEAAYEDAQELIQAEESASEFPAAIA